MMSDNAPAGGFRVLWVGDPDVLPADAKVAAGDVGFALTRGGVGDARVSWAAPEQHADRVLAQKELGERLQRALDNLPFDQRTAIVLREIDGLSYEEIAFSLGVAVGTVKSRLTRARQALRLELREARIA